jgi:hypothetical protein
MESQGICSNCGASLLYPVLYAGRIWGRDCLATHLGVAHWQLALRSRDGRMELDTDALAARAARLAAARDASARHAEMLEQKRQHYTVANAWLIDVLRDSPSYFAQEIAQNLRRASIDELLSDKAFRAVRDIYGKMSGRRGSKAYNAAVEEFDARTVDQPAEAVA